MCSLTTFPSHSHSTWWHIKVYFLLPYFQLTVKFSNMPYQKRLQKSYGAIESQAQSGSSNNGDGGFGSTKQNLPNNNNNVSIFGWLLIWYYVCPRLESLKRLLRMTTNFIYFHIIFEYLQDHIICAMEESPVMASPQHEESKPLLGQAYDNISRER